MGIIEHAFNFFIAMALVLLTWLIYLWINNKISRVVMPAQKEILGALLSIGLFAALAGILYFFSMSMAVGAIIVLLLISLMYIVRKGGRLMLSKRPN